MNFPVKPSFGDRGIMYVQADSSTKAASGIS